ncbi:MAG: hypothetical protein JWO38_611, partial [Gemmataceae bacterium]|nr:hypothetical protein [Gemmataceae bacterium]
ERAALTRGRVWKKVMGGFSRPGKKPGLAWEIPAEHHRAGSEPDNVDGARHVRKC